MYNLANITNFSTYKFIRVVDYTIDDAVTSSEDITTTTYVTNNLSVPIPQYPQSNYPYLKVELVNLSAKVDLYSKVQTGSIFSCPFVPHINNVVELTDPKRNHVYLGYAGGLLLFKKGLGHPAYALIPGSPYSGYTTYTPWSTQDDTGSATATPVYTLNGFTYLTVKPEIEDLLKGKVSILEMRTTAFI